MNYSFKFSLSSGGLQPEVTAILQREGFEFIQTSYGLCVRAPLSIEQLKEKIGAPAKEITIAKIDPQEETKDVQAFIDGKT